MAPKVKQRIIDHLMSQSKTLPLLFKGSHRYTFSPKAGKPKTRDEKFKDEQWHERRSSDENENTVVKSYLRRKTEDFRSYLIMQLFAFASCPSTDRLNL